jgi:hypothetical protein
MPWNESEFVERAKDIALQHVTTKKSINELSMKVARENSLNPDEIRTLVRLSNVSTFQECFKRKSDGDKMVEFDVGDPEQVIRKFAEEASEVPQSANIFNDKLAEEIPDLMREKRLGHKFDDAEKVASEFVPAPEKPMRRDLAILALRKLAEDFNVEQIAAGRRWEDKIAALAQTFKRAPGYGPKLDDFEKDAYAEFGHDAVPELKQLWADLRRGEYAELINEKVAELQDRRVTEETPELALLKEAVDARHAYVKFRNGLEWIKKQGV